MNNSKIQKELKEAWLEYKKVYKESGRVGGIPNLVSFTALFNRAMGMNIPIPKVYGEDSKHSS